LTRRRRQPEDAETCGGGRVGKAGVECVGCSGRECGGDDRMPNPGSTSCWVGPGPQAPRSPKQGPCVESGSRLPVTLPAAPCPAAAVHADGRKSPRVATGESLAGGSGPFHTDFQGGLYQCGGADGEAGDGTGRCTGGGGAATAGTESGGAGDDPDGSSASPRSSTSDSELESRNLPTPSPRCSDEVRTIS
jgi:hypothetical protein